MQMIEAANKIASDKLHRLEQAEIARLRRELADAYQRLEADAVEYEVDHGRLIKIESVIDTVCRNIS